MIKKLCMYKFQGFLRFKINKSEQCDAILQMNLNHLYDI